VADVRVADLPTVAAISNNDYLIIDRTPNAAPTGKSTISAFKQAMTPASFPWNSEVPVATGVHSRWYAPRSGTITGCQGHVVDGDGSSTANFDVLLNGSTIFPSATKPSVSAGQYTGTERTPDTTSFAKGDYFQVEVTATGGTAGRLRLIINFY
jgi:hypothetical protein